jgi:filamentous hemagglutinin
MAAPPRPWCRSCTCAFKDGDINGHGALLAADSVNLKITDALNNGGTIAGRTATAARDINAKAAQIANSGAGGSITLAAGNNVNLDTVAEKSTQSLTWDASNYRKEALSSEVGSSITASGDVRVMAGNDINARGLNATMDCSVVNADNEAEAAA